MKNQLMNIENKILLRKRAIAETINDELKNHCQIECSRHRAVSNFTMNTLPALTAYCFFLKTGIESGKSLSRTAISKIP